jgi:hypothetical protein
LFDARSKCVDAASGASDSDSMQRAQHLCVEQSQGVATVERYLEGFDRLQIPSIKPGLIVIAGVPPDLAPPQTTSVEPRAEDPALDAAYYDAVLADPRMIWTPADAGSGYVPSCVHASGPAYPPRRLVELVKDAGYFQGVLGSLCDDDLTKPIYEYFARNQVISDPLVDPGDFCEPHLLEPSDASGLVACHMYWELPATREAFRPATPIACDEDPGLLSLPTLPTVGLHTMQGALCEVTQVPVLDPERGPANGFGFYADRSQEGTDQCLYDRLITYTPGARPPEGVVAHLRCTTAHSSEPPMACQSDRDCPTGWVCGVDGGAFGLPETATVCVNPRPTNLSEDQCLSGAPFLNP